MAQTRQKHSDDQLSLWLTRCNPSMPVGPESELHYPLDQGGRLRGDFKLENMIRPLRLSGNSSCQLFTGFSGTGKSSELLRLKKELEARDFVVLLANAQEYLTLSRPLEIEDLLAVLAGAMSDETDRLIGGNSQVVPGYWDELLHVLQKEVELGEVKIKMGVLDLKFNVKHGNDLWKDARERLAMTPGRFEDLAHGHVRECVQRLKHKFPKALGVVFMLDSLEKLRGSTVAQFQEIMNSAVRTFSDYSHELHLPECHVIYTVPPYLTLLAPWLASRYDQINEILPAIKVEQILSRSPIQLKPFKLGVVALRELVGLRVPLETFFGRSFRHLDELIVKSGGHVRTLISMVRDLVYRVDERGGPVDGNDIKTIVNRFRERSLLGVWEEHTLLLNKIQQEASVVGIRQEDLPIVADFMDRQIVLCYRNGDGWYQVHPLVREYVQQRLALAFAEPNKSEGF